MFGTKMGIINQRMFLYIEFFFNQLRSSMASSLVSLPSTICFLWRHFKRQDHNTGLTLLKRLAMLQIILSITIQSKAQGTITIDYLLGKIEMQQLTNDNYFIEGVFPSYINASRKYKTKKK